MKGVASLPRSIPEVQGIPANAILSFVDAVEREVRHLHSFVLLRHGSIVAEGYCQPYGPTSPHMQFSLCKSLTSIAVGMLVGVHRLTLDDLVLDFFPDAAPAVPAENLRKMRVRHLLTMTTGHDANLLRQIRLAGPAWTRGFLAQPVEHEPGTHFVYNDAAAYILSAIVQRITGERLTQYLRPRLLDPLGFDQLSWAISPEGIDLGGWDMDATTAAVRAFRPALPSAWRLARPAARTGGLGRGGDRKSSPERGDTRRRVGAGLRLPLLALQPQRLPRRWRLRPALRGDAGAGCRPGNERGCEPRHVRPAARAGLGAPPAGNGAGAAPTGSSN